MYLVISAVKTPLAVLAIVAAVAAILALASVYATFPGDEWALRELKQLRTGWLNDLAVAVSTLGRGGIGWGLAAPWVPLAALAAGLAMRRWADAAFLAASTLAPVLNLGLKELVARPRPDTDLWLLVETGFAFPSGHSVFAASFVGALIWLLRRSKTFDGRPIAKCAIQTFLLLLILAVGLSRVYLGVHWPSDVIAGFLLGGLYLLLLLSVRNWLDRRRKVAA